MLRGCDSQHLYFATILATLSVHTMAIRLGTILLIFLYLAPAHAARIPSYPMTSLILLSDVVVYCEETDIQTKDIKYENSKLRRTIIKKTTIKCKVLSTIKGGFKPDSELTVEYDGIFHRYIEADRFVPPYKTTSLPVGKALLFLRRNTDGTFEVIDAKLVQQNKVYKFKQFANPGGLSLVPQEPENIQLLIGPYDEQALLEDIALALKKSTMMKNPPPLPPM